MIYRDRTHTYQHFESLLQWIGRQERSALIKLVAEVRKIEREKRKECLIDSESGGN